MATTDKVSFTQDADGRWWIPKDPDAVLDYSINWAKWLAKVGGDTIASVQIVLAQGTELTEQSSAVNGAVTTAMIAGGTTPDSLQSVTFRIITTAGRTEDRTVYLKITAR